MFVWCSTSFLAVNVIPFCSADINGDGLLSLLELSDWISEKIQEHINEALRENFRLFVAIDNNPRNGRLALYMLIFRRTWRKMVT
jgi:hypothetical protein